jgi:hypothetical protein
MERFFQDNLVFCRYYDSDSESRDELIFTERNTEPYPIDVTAIGLPGDLNSGCVQVSTVIAFRKYAALLKEEPILSPPAFSISSSISLLRISSPTTK